MSTTHRIHPAEAIRRLYGWSRSDLATRADMNRETLRQKLSKPDPLSLGETLALAHALDVPHPVLAEMTDEEAIQWVLAEQPGWQERRCFRASRSVSPGRVNATSSPHGPDVTSDRAA